MTFRFFAFVSFLTLAHAQIWTQLSPGGNPPPPRAWTSAVFDSTAQRMIIFAGQSTGPLNDTWSLATGATPQWTALSPKSGLPQARLGHAAGYDARNSRMIIFGGGNMATPPACLNDVWTLNNIGNVDTGPSWTPMQTAGRGIPAPRIFHTAVYDPNTNRLIVFGGKDCTQNGVYFNDVWTLSNIGVPGAVPTWTQLQASGTPPSAREGHAAVFDVSTNRMIIFAGDAGADPLSDVWVLNNANGVTGPPNWSQVPTTGVGPVPRTFAVAAWDTVGNRLIINGGASGSTTLSDTYALSGIGSPFAPAMWTQLPIIGSTPSKSAAVAVFDPGSNRMLVFGGSRTNSPQNDTWALNLTQQQTQPVTVTTTSVPNAQVGVPYTAQLSAANGTPPYGGWTVTTGTLPPGLTLNSATGVISGTPTTATGSPFSFSVTVKDGTGAVSAPQALTITIPSNAGVVVSTATLPAAQVGVAYSVTLTATGGTPPYGNWVVITGSLPPGLTLNTSTGVISGTPATSAGSPFTFSVTVRDNASNISPAQSLTITVSSGITISPTTLPGGTIGVAYTVQLMASNGTPPYSNWTVSAGALPAGLTLNAGTGVISGTPTAAANANFSVTVQDARGSTSSPQALAIAVTTAITITSTSLPGSSVGATYAAQLTVAGGMPPYSNWVVVSGTLPGGLTLSPTTGAILGVPLTAGNFTFSVTVKDSAGAVAPAQNFAITVAARVNVTTTSLPGAAVGVAYTAQLTAADGVPPYGNWAVSSGSLPPGLTLNAASGQISGTPTSGSGTISFSVTVKDSAGGTSVPQSLSISFGPPPALTTAPAAISFSYRLGDPAPAPQSISVFSGGAFTVAATSDQNFLVATPATGQTPATVTLSVNISGLRAGMLNGQVVIALAGSPSTSATVQVTLNVVAPAGPQLQVSPPRFSLNSVQGASPAHLQLAVLNSGGGTLNYSAQLNFVSGANWASLDNSSGAATFATPGSVGITINSGQLTPGVYEVDVTVQDQASSQSQTVAVILSVASQSLSIQLGQAGLQFTAAGGVASPPQSFTVGNAGQGALNWSAAAEVLSGPVGWLVATPGSGVSMAGAATSPAVTVSIDASGLTMGQFVGRVRITAPGAANNPQIVTVVVNVTDPTQSGPALDDAGVLIVGDPAVPSPPPAQIAIANLGGKALTFVSTASTEDGKNWASLSTAAGTLPVTGLTNIGVQANFSGLTAGVRRGLMRLAFSDGSVRTISVTSVLPPTGATATSLNPVRDAGCAATALVPAILSLEPGFTVTGTTPVSLRVAVADTCGTPVTSGGVTVSFSDGSRGIALTHAGNGAWTGTWVPLNNNAAIALVVTAFSFGNPPLAGQTPALNGTIRTANSPLARADRIYDGASFKPGDQVSVGSSASVFGDGLADGEINAPGPQYGATLGNTQVLLGDQPLPLLYVNSTQVNALIPRNLTPNTQHQVVVQHGSSISVPIQVTVADIGPGIYTTNRQGTGQGAVEIANTALIVAPVSDTSRPAQRGEIISIFMTGLGDVDNPPPDGSPAPLDSLVHTLATPVVTIGGAMADVQFSGLAPGLAGYYQVNVFVPDAAPSGDAVTLIVSLNGVPSNPVTIAIQ